MARYSQALSWARERVPTSRETNILAGRLVRTAQIGFGAFTGSYINATKPTIWGFPTLLALTLAGYGVAATGMAGHLSDNIADMADGVFAAWVGAQGAQAARGATVSGVGWHGEIGDGVGVPIPSAGMDEELLREAGLL